MYIKKLKIKNYRNYKNAEIDFDPNINIIYGNNAEGKTNLLEAIYFSSTTRSHRNSKENDIINFDEKEAHIKLVVCDKNAVEKTIDIQINKDNKKGIAVNGIKKERISEYLGTINVILFAPEDLNIIKDGPLVRRKFLDIAICQTDKIYVATISNYQKTINQRNALLRDINYSEITNKKDLLDLLDSYDIQLANLGTEIMSRRKKYTDELKIKTRDIHGKISDDKEELIIEYEKNIESFDKEFYINVLKEKREEDLKNMFTSVGPHRDDISFTIKGKDIRKFGSQGQKKTIAISLKLAELSLIKENSNDAPILLLDDVFSELDEIRQMHLVQNIKNIQTIITCTGIKKNIFEILKPNKIFKVENKEIIMRSK